MDGVMLVFVRHDGYRSLRSRPDAACATDNPFDISSRRSPVAEMKKLPNALYQPISRLRSGWKIYPETRTMTNNKNESNFKWKEWWLKNENKAEKRLISVMTYQRLHLSLHLRLLHGVRYLKSIYFFHHFGTNSTSVCLPKSVDRCLKIWLKIRRDWWSSDLERSRYFSDDELHPSSQYVG